MTWPPTTVADPIAALVEHLRTALAVAAGGRVFAGSLPRTEVASMPRAGVLLRAAGGPTQPAHAPLVIVRVDVHAYGATPYAAMTMHWAAFGALRDLTRLTIAGTLLHSCVPETGPFSQTDPDTEWPEVVSSWRVTAAEHVPV